MEAFNPNPQGKTSKTIPNRLIENLQLRLKIEEKKKNFHYLEETLSLVTSENQKLKKALNISDPFGKLPNLENSSNSLFFEDLSSCRSEIRRKLELTKSKSFIFHHQFSSLTILESFLILIFGFLLSSFTSQLISNRTVL
jgi:hypothetical protein